MTALGATRRPRGLAPLRDEADWELDARAEWYARAAVDFPWDAHVYAELYLEAARELARRRKLPYRRAEAPFDANALVHVVKDRADILSVFGSRGYLADAKRSGTSIVASCPFHAERTPSFHVWPDEGRYKCFGCGESGDCLDAVQRLDGLPFTEALTELAREFGIEPPKRLALRLLG